jgi:hypothetical protein
MAVWSNIPARVAAEHGGRTPKRGPKRSDKAVAIGLAAFTIVVAAVIVAANLL